MAEKVTHYNAEGEGWTACGIKSDNLTCVVRKVTCGKCKRSWDYKYMMREP